MMPAAKHGDPQLGVDIHLCVVPPSPSPVPLPTPHMSIVFDPFDYVPYIGATVTVCGMKRATAGTNATVVHIPPGFPFAPKLPDKDDELFMGSATVVADGDPFSFISVPVLGCQVAGMPSIPRLKKKGAPKAMLLPTTFNVAIPTSVFIGGPPTISMMGMLSKLGFAALGKFAKSALFKRIRQKLFGHMKPGFLKCKILRAEPVNILTGEVSVEQEDFTLPGRLPLQWARSYSSSNRHEGLCGPGWETPADARLEVDESDGSVLMHYPLIGPLFFPQLPAAQGDGEAVLELMDGARLVDRGHEYQVRTKDDRLYHFPKALALTAPDGKREIPLGRIADLCGNWLEFERYTGRLTGIAESAGRRIEIDRGQGRSTEIALYDGLTRAHHVLVRYERDAAGDLANVFDAVGNPYGFGYDEHHIVRHTDRNGLSFYYEYDKQPAEGWRVVHAWGDGNLYNYRFEYSDALNERRITDSLGNVSIVKLDERGLPISEIDPLGGMTIFEYDDVGRTTAVTDPGSHRTGYDYDERGNLLTLTRPDGKGIATEFNPGDKATIITNPNGAIWQQEWDARGLLTRQITPLGAESTYEYDTRGQLVGFTNPLGARTALAFDGVGNLARLTDALGHATAFAYDALGNVTAKTDALGQTARYTYDAKSRLTQAVLPSGAAIACAYDHEDNLTRYVDENGAETRLEYFGLGEIKRRIQPDGHSVEYHYDTEERLIGVSNQRGERYELKRDALGRIVEEIDYWGQGRRYVYTAAGYLTESVDPLGRVIRYQTDPLGRIFKKLLPDPVRPDAVQEETCAYDANSNLIACENAAIRITRQFDPEGRLLEERQGDECVVANTYDLNGNRVTRTTALELGGQSYANTVNYRFDELDQAIAVEVEGHSPLRLRRNALGQVTEERLSPALQRRLSYSSDGYLTAQEVLLDARPFFDQAYTYDAAGNLIEKRDSEYGVERFTYDPLGRLVAHLDPQQRLKRYLADPAGDRLRTRVVQQPNGGDSDHEWSREGEYEGAFYRFDRAGNLVHRSDSVGDTHFSWDANQRLIASHRNDKTTTYQYDPLNRRVAKQTGDFLTRFYWDGDALLGDVLINKGEGKDPTPLRLREWIYYPETFEPLVLVQGYGAAPPEAAAVSPPDLYFYHNDPNGCPTRLLDTAGRVVWAARYRAWGGVERLLVELVDNPIRLQGQYEDGETGLHYNRYRYFGSDLGVFITQDPLRLETGEKLYTFAPNVWGWIDLLGLSCSRSNAFQKAKDRLGIPRSQQPTRSWTIHDPAHVKGPGVRHPDPRHQGKIHEFAIPTEGGGTRYVYVVDHNHDPFHGGIGHVHTAEPKPGASRLNPGDRYSETGEYIAYDRR